MTFDGTNGNYGNGYKPGESGNPRGRAPKKLERHYFEVAKRRCSDKQWSEIVRLAVQEARDPHAHPIARDKARTFLMKALSLETMKLVVEGNAQKPIVIEFVNDWQPNMLTVDAEAHAEDPDPGPA